MDGIDGRLARMLNASSEFGAQLDSLTDFGMNDVLDLLKNKPEILELNKESMINSGYYKSIQNDKKIVPSKLERLSNFISIVTKLVYLKENPESIKSINREVFTLKEDLNKLKCFHKIWLQEKIEELR